MDPYQDLMSQELEQLDNLEEFQMDLNQMNVNLPANFKGN